MVWGVEPPEVTHDTRDQQNSTKEACDFEKIKTYQLHQQDPGGRHIRFIEGRRIQYTTLSAVIMSTQCMIENGKSASSGQLYPARGLSPHA